MDKKTCPNCNNSGNIDRNLTCQTCGSQLELDLETNTYILKLIDCSGCGYPNSARANYCSKCRKKIIKEYKIISRNSKKNSKKVLSGILAAFLVFIAALWFYSTGFSKQKVELNYLLPSATQKVILASNNLSAFLASNVKESPQEPDNLRMDVVFCIDTTGSMGDEIAVIKAQLLKMVEEIQQGSPPPDVRFGVVAYRDHGDEYVTKSNPLIYDISETQNIINSLTAKGGGDYPESVSEGLSVSVREMNWDENESVKKIIFLIGDASPQYYEQGPHYKTEMKVAAKNGIMVNTISCSGMEQEGNDVFQEIANATNGCFEYLTYRYAYEDGSGKKQVILNQAGRDYIVDEAYIDDDDWRSGATEMEERNKAKEYPAGGSGIFCGIEPSSTTEYDCGETCGDTEDSYTKTEDVNNLDSIMTDSLKNEAIKSGVTY